MHYAVCTITQLPFLNCSQRHWHLQCMLQSLSLNQSRHSFWTICAFASSSASFCPSFSCPCFFSFSCCGGGHWRRSSLNQMRMRRWCPGAAAEAAESWIEQKEKVRLQSSIGKGKQVMRALNGSAGKNVKRLWQSLFDRSGCTVRQVSFVFQCVQ